MSNTYDNAKRKRCGFLNYRKEKGKKIILINS